MIYKQFEYQYTHAEIFKENLIRNSYMLNLTVLWNFQQGSNFIISFKGGNLIFQQNIGSYV